MEHQQHNSAVFVAPTAALHQPHLYPLGAAQPHPLVHAAPAAAFQQTCAPQNLEQHQALPSVVQYVNFAPQQTCAAAAVPHPMTSPTTLVVTPTLLSQHQGPAVGPAMWLPTPFPTAVLSNHVNNTATSLSAIHGGNSMSQDSRGSEDFMCPTPHATVPSAAQQGVSDDSAVPLPEATNVFVCMLPSWVRDAELTEIFSPYGFIESAKVMLNIHTGQSKAIAFVKFSKHEEAQRAIRALDGTSIGGQRIGVRMAEARAAYQPSAPTKKTFVRNVPPSVTQSMLLEYFSQFGEVTEVSILPDSAQAASTTIFSAPLATPGGVEADPRRIAFAAFSTVEAAVAAARATHLQKPFADCGDIPLLAKTAEDSARRSERLTSSSQRRRSSNLSNSNRSDTSSASQSIPIASPVVQSVPSSASFISHDYHQPPVAGLHHPCLDRPPQLAFADQTLQFNVVPCPPQHHAATSVHPVHYWVQQAPGSHAQIPTTGQDAVSFAVHHLGAHSFIPPSTQPLPYHHAYAAHPFYPGGLVGVAPAISQSAVFQPHHVQAQISASYLPSRNPTLHFETPAAPQAPLIGGHPIFAAPAPLAAITRQQAPPVSPLRRET